MESQTTTTDTTTERAFSVDAAAPRTSTAPKKKAAPKANANEAKKANARIAADRKAAGGELPSEKAMRLAAEERKKHGDSRDETPAQKQRAADAKARAEARDPARKPKTAKSASPKTLANAAARKAAEANGETPGAAAVAAPENVPDAATPKAPKAKAPGVRDALDALWNDEALPVTESLNVRDLASAYILFLESGGQTTLSTISSYTNDLKTAVAFFGPDTLVARIGRGWRGEFDESKAVNFLKSGEPKAKPTVLKMRRTFRMAVEWARGNKITAYAVAP